MYLSSFLTLTWILVAPPSNCVHSAYIQICLLFSEVSLRFLMILFYFLFVWLFCLYKWGESSIVSSTNVRFHKCLDHFFALEHRFCWFYHDNFPESMTESVLLPPSARLFAPFLFRHVYVLGRQRNYVQCFFHVFVWICWLDLIVWNQGCWHSSQKTANKHFSVATYMVDTYY